MEKKELGEIKTSLKTKFEEYDKNGHVCGMSDIIARVIDEADDVRASKTVTKLFVGDEVELLVTPCSYALTITTQDKDNFRKHHCLEYMHNLPDKTGYGEVFSIEKYELQYEEEFREDMKLPDVCLTMSDRVTHLRVLRQDGALKERTVDKMPYHEHNLDGFKKQFVQDKNFVTVKNEMASVLDKIVERIHE